MEKKRPNQIIDNQLLIHLGTNYALYLAEFISLSVFISNPYGIPNAFFDTIVVLSNVIETFFGAHDTQDKVVNVAALIGSIATIAALKNI